MLLVKLGHNFHQFKLKLLVLLLEDAHQLSVVTLLRRGLKCIYFSMYFSNVFSVHLQLRAVLDDFSEPLRSLSLKYVGYKLGILFDNLHSVFESLL
jgi:hypothetical protein